MCYVDERAVEGVEEVFELRGCGCKGRWDGLFGDVVGLFARARLRFGRHCECVMGGPRASCAAQVALVMVKRIVVVVRPNGRSCRFQASFRWVSPCRKSGVERICILHPASFGKAVGRKRRV